MAKCRICEKEVDSVNNDLVCSICDRVLVLEKIVQTLEEKRMELQEIEDLEIDEIISQLEETVAFIEEGYNEI